MTEEQIYDLKEAYAEMIVDDMDTKCLMQFVYDTIINNLPDDENELIKEIGYVYDDDVITNLIYSVTGN